MYTIKADRELEDYLWRISHAIVNAFKVGSSDRSGKDQRKLIAERAKRQLVYDMNTLEYLKPGYASRLPVSVVGHRV